MKKLFKKAFTLVELLVVIAILATLSGITVIGYGSFKKQAAKKADAANVDDMNAYIRAYEVLNTIDDYKELYNALLNDDSFDVNKLTAQTKNARFGYDTVHHKMGLFDISTGKAIYAPNYAEGASFGNEIYMTADNEASLKSAGSHLVVKDIKLSEKVTFDHLSSIDMLDNANVIGNLEYVTTDAGNMNIKGSIVGDVTFNTPNAHVEQYGILDGTLTQTAVSSTTLVIDGYVAKLNVGSGSVKVNTDATIREITNTADFAIGSGNTFVNDGYINYVPSTVTNVATAVTNNGFIGLQYTDSTTTSACLKAADYALDYTVNVTNYEELLKFSTKTQHKDSPYIVHDTAVNANNALNYHTINLNVVNDIEFGEAKWIPIAAWATPSTGYSYVFTADTTPQKFNNVHIVFNGNNHKLENVKDALIGVAGISTIVKDLNLVLNKDNRVGAVDEGKGNYFLYNDHGKIIQQEYTGGRWCHMGFIFNNVLVENSVNSISGIYVKIQNCNVSGVGYYHEWAPDSPTPAIVVNPYCGYYLDYGSTTHFTVESCTVTAYLGGDCTKITYPRRWSDDNYHDLWGDKN